MEGTDAGGSQEQQPAAPAAPAEASPAADKKKPAFAKPAFTKPAPKPKSTTQVGVWHGGCSVFA
jgi:hypothetical protein